MAWAAVLAALLAVAVGAALSLWRTLQQLPKPEKVRKCVRFACSLD